MRFPWESKKPSGFWKIHQNCGVCQKPRRYRKEVLLREKTKEALEAASCTCPETDETPQGQEGEGAEETAEGGL